MSKVGLEALNLIYYDDDCGGTRTPRGHAVGAGYRLPLALGRLLEVRNARVDSGAASLATAAAAMWLVR